MSGAARAPGRKRQKTVSENQYQGTSMRRWLLGGVLALGLVAFGNRGVQPSTGGETRKPRWLTDYAAAQKAARRSGQPIFVVFR
jgi:hypothetical protein